LYHSGGISRYFKGNFPNTVTFQKQNRAVLG